MEYECEVCGAEYQLPEGGVIVGVDDDCSCMTHLVMVCSECYHDEPELESPSG